MLFFSFNKDENWFATLKKVAILKTKLLAENDHVIDIFTSEDIYVIYRLGDPYWKNIFPRSQKRPETEGRGTLLRPKEDIFQYGPTLTVNNVFIFLCAIPNQILKKFQFRNRL